MNKRLTGLMVICGMVLATSLQGAVILSEDFESYATPTTLDSGTNPNGWAYYSSQIVHDLRWGSAYGAYYPPFYPTSTSQVRDGISSKEMGSTDSLNRAASIASPVRFSSGQLAVTYDLRVPADGPEMTGVRIADSVGGGFVDLVYAYSCFFLITPDAASGFGDSGNYARDWQYATMNIDLNTQTVTAGVTCANAIYSGSTAAASTSLALPTGFAADTVILWNQYISGQTYAYSCRVDNLVVDYVPEPATISLILLGLAGLLRRR